MRWRRLRSGASVAADEAIPTTEGDAATVDVRDAGTTVEVECADVSGAGARVQAGQGTTVRLGPDEPGSRNDVRRDTGTETQVKCDAHGWRTNGTL